MKKTKKGRAAQMRQAEKQSVNLERQLAELKQRAEKAEYELGRYMKAVGTRNHIIAKLEERLKIEDRKQQSNEALVALLLIELGADMDHPVRVEHKAVLEALQDYRVLIALDEEEQTYSLSFVKGEKEKDRSAAQ